MGKKLKTHYIDSTRINAYLYPLCGTSNETACLLVTSDTSEVDCKRCRHFLDKQVTITNAPERERKLKTEFINGALVLKNKENKAMEREQLIEGISNQQEALREMRSRLGGCTWVLHEKLSNNYKNKSNQSKDMIAMGKISEAVQLLKAADTKIREANELIKNVGETE